MRNERQPLYMIGIAAKLCGVHPQTLRQYERLGLVIPARIGAKNRLFCEADILRVQRIQRLTQQLGVNLAGVEIILRMIDEMEDLRLDMEHQFEEYRREAERRIEHLMSNSNVPLRKDAQLLPAMSVKFRRIEI